MRQKIASETSEEREARLQQLILNQQQRLATESQEEREARVQQMIFIIIIIINRVLQYSGSKTKWALVNE